jgi:prevent-host-death family protein
MRTAGIREVRQNITALLEQVKKGREVTITDRGRVVPAPPLRKPFPDMTEFRRSLKSFTKSVSDAVIEERNESPY